VPQELWDEVQAVLTDNRTAHHRARTTVFVSVSTNLEYVDKALVRAARSLGARTCGLTFTFGGLKISNEGEIESTDGHVIPGLFAAGELVGGLFYHNYPGGTGLVSGAVLGKLAGDGAGKYVAGKN